MGRRILLLVVELMLGAGCQRNGAGSSSTSAPSGLPAPALPGWFEDVTAQTGVQSTYRNGEEVVPPHLSILESLGGGVAAFDFDGDGWQDLYFPGGGYYDGPDKRTIRGHAGKLYRNNGDGTFTDVTAPTGLATLAGGEPWFYSHAVATCDYDADGWVDLLVTGYGRVALFRNEPAEGGGRRFTDVTRAAGLHDGITWATSAAWADFDGDGHADLYVCQYVNWSFANHPACSYDGKTPDVCPPKNFEGLPHKLFRNRGDGTFEDVSARALGGAASKGLGVVVVDLSGDGKPDIYAANDTVPNFLWLNESVPGEIRLSEQGVRRGAALDATGGSNGSMGVDAADPLRSGRASLIVTNYENELPAFYRNIPASGKSVGPQFLFASPATGIAAIGNRFVGWGTLFADFDRDGLEDLIITNGHAIRYPSNTTREQRAVLMRNQGNGKLVDINAEAGSYFQGKHLGRGMVTVDLDNDGRLDLVFAPMNAPATVLRNVTPLTNTWVGVELVGTDHRDIVGAQVTLTAGGQTQTRFAKGGGSYASSPDRRFVFGLGSETTADLTITWPTGQTQTVANVPTGRYTVVQQQ